MMNPNSIIKNIVAQACKVPQYIQLIRMFKQGNVSDDLIFSELFTSFYNIPKQRLPLLYFSILENQKESNLSFERLLFCLSNHVNRVDPFISSYIVSLSNQRMPTWSLFNLRLVEHDKEYSRVQVLHNDRKEAKIELFSKWYNDICEYYQALINESNTQKCIRVFRELCAEDGFVFSDMRIIEWLLSFDEIT